MGLLRRSHHRMAVSIMSRWAEPPPVIVPQAAMVRIWIPGICVAGVPMGVRVILDSAVSMGIVRWEIERRYQTRRQDGTESHILRRWHRRKVKALGRVIMMLIMM
jgi:hypothetical protein